MLSKTKLDNIIQSIVDSSSNIKALLKKSSLSDQIQLESKKNLNQCLELILKVEADLKEEVKENDFQVTIKNIKSLKLSN